MLIQNAQSILDQYYWTMVRLRGSIEIANLFVDFAVKKCFEIRFRVCLPKFQIMTVLGKTFYPMSEL